MNNTTKEQQLVIASKAEVLLVNAFAGTGKTSTLVRYAEANPRERVLYLAFNRAIANEAGQKFPSNVQARTTHSLAYGSFGELYRPKLGELAPSHLMRAYRFNVMLASQVVETVLAYVRSADTAIGLQHVPEIVPVAERESLLPLATKVWKDVKDPSNKDIPMPHDGYLKLYQLTQPNLKKRFTTILIDEAQDINPATADIVLRQDVKLVLVGDRHQSIYAFRGAKNAFELAEQIASAKNRKIERLALTQSFRFGSGVAAVATRLLQGLKKETLSVIGKDGLDTSFVVDREKPYAIIQRTNAKVFARAVELLGKKSFAIVGAENFPFGKIVDVFYLWTDRLTEIRDPFIRSFGTFAKIEEYALAADDKELLSLFQVVKQFKASIPTLVPMVKQALVAQDQAHITLSTAHKSKGLEFDQVILGEDFENFVDEEGFVRADEMDDLDQEANLVYVAVTRAIKAIELNSSINNVFAALDAGKVRDVKEPFANDAKGVAENVSVAPLSATDGLDESAWLGFPTYGTQMPAATPKSESRAEQLAQKIKDSILREGLMTADEIARDLGENVHVVAALIARMIGAGGLSEKLFSQCQKVGFWLSGEGEFL
ncbi:UvrD-helicase domain-containing protein [Propionivibrio dicarboxylicus]|uniref:DNA 3'-5' helicase n=1 Tax=Propionivibrio dicarboxylicus TaxID=83767 RepID=A0A1G8F2E2_9RHOO|nr:UvrD-helicase domain-containing protein [Propionivibrio dicarboxylicus]SDH76323.1 Part of AAA domain-containing protein [Propionivibrio dicarboxylicus]